ncbi:hypothetical protein A9798_10700 [Edwardsiella hoshinae]|uniref:Transmembrane protein n=1 Tax=Edwardsiella hoshinae TaxID=93378 RepID=A0ABM6EK92_9GAMM|nr:hypothetical protein A9798_10700 [Edwardsiella hoshinae]
MSLTFSLSILEMIDLAKPPAPIMIKFFTPAPRQVILKVYTQSAHCNQFFNIFNRYFIKKFTFNQDTIHTRHIKNIKLNSASHAINIHNRVFFAQQHYNMFRNHILIFRGKKVSIKKTRIFSRVRNVVNIIIFLQKITHIQCNLIAITLIISHFAIYSTKK